jgi:hypothetical protein
VSLFDDDLDTVDVCLPIDEVDLLVGDAMWFSPTWYQTVRFKTAASCLLRFESNLVHGGEQGADRAGLLLMDGT